VLVHPNNPNAHRNKFTVRDWRDPASTVMGATRPGSGAPSVADPRAAERFGNSLRVVPWDAAVADPRVKVAFDHGYRVLPWAQPSFTVAGGSHPGQGAYSVADPRVKSEPRAGAYGVIEWHEAAKTVTGAASIDNGAFAVADPRAPDDPFMVIRDIRKPPPAVPVIISEDGTWHRPLTTLELAALQGLPTRMPDGSPLRLAGESQSAWRERIGNAVPPPAAQAIAEQMLVTLVHADLDRMSLSGNLDVWVEPEATVRS
jgi:site-specific DNA-cytosine methylase